MKRTTIRTVRIVMVAALVGMSVAALPASTAFAGKTCPKTVTVADGGQLGAAIVEVCQGGAVVIDPGVTTIAASAIHVAKTVKVLGNGLQTIYGSSVFTVDPTGTLKLEDVSVTNVGEGRFGLIAYGVLVLKGVTVSGYNNAILSYPGSGVTLNRGTVVTGNTGGHYAEGGAGVWVDGGTVTLNNDAAVRDNLDYACFSAGMTSYGWGAGMFVKNGGSLTLNDYATVSGNTLRHCDPTRNTFGGAGGGISARDSTVTLNGRAQVTGNQAANGGGIDVEVSSGGQAVLTLNDEASITGNYAIGTGGGVRLYPRAGTQLFMNGASTISGNTADGNGGGVHNISGAVTLNGTASITGNTAGGSGGGVCNTAFLSPPVFIMNELATITGNSPDDIYPIP